MNYAKIKHCDVANGPGVRTTLFVSGCRHQCKNCFNKEAWDFEYGEKFTDETVEKIIELMKSDHISGLTVLGGEPFEPENIIDVAELILKVRETYPTKSIWVYTGGIYEKIVAKDYYLTPNGTPNILATLAKEAVLNGYIDVLVDGPFVEELKNPMLMFRGSSNQRLIDIKKTYECGKVVLVDESEFKTTSRSKYEK